MSPSNLRSHQDPSQAPNHSDSCDDWTLDYTMIQSSGRWLIDNANAAPGVPEYQSSDEINRDSPDRQRTRPGALSGIRWYAGPGGGETGPRGK